MDFGAGVVGTLDSFLQIREAMLEGGWDARLAGAYLLDDASHSVILARLLLLVLPITGLELLLLLLVHLALILPLLLVLLLPSGGEVLLLLIFPALGLLLGWLFLLLYLLQGGLVGRVVERPKWGSDEERSQRIGFDILLQALLELIEDGLGTSEQGEVEVGLSSTLGGRR